MREQINQRVRRDFSTWDNDMLEVLIKDYKQNIMDYKKHIKSFESDRIDAQHELITRQIPLRRNGNE